MNKKNQWVYLTHMWAMCKKALDLVKGLEKAEFLRNEILQLALTRLIEVIGEAASHVDELHGLSKKPSPGMRSLACGIE